jgi:hypothetical protein
MTNFKSTVLAAAALMAALTSQALAHPGHEGGGAHVSVSVHGGAVGFRGGYRGGYGRPGYYGAGYGYRYGFYNGVRGYWNPAGVWVAGCAPVFGGYDAYGNAIWSNVCN